MLHLVLDSQRHPYIAARPGNDGLVGRRSSVREEDIGLIDEGFPGNSFVVREPVSSWERHDQAIQPSEVIGFLSKSSTRANALTPTSTAPALFSKRPEA